MSRQADAIETYLQDLATRLEILGPQESGEVVAEIRAHLAEAVTDAGGDKDLALMQFGSAESLSTRILEERGVIATGSTVPDAPMVTQLAAAGIDLMLWLVLCFFVYTLFVLKVVAGFYPDSGFLPIFVMWTAIILTAGAALWWWAIRRRKPGFKSTGMEMLRLRRIRVGNTTHVVRERDIPGLPKGNRVVALVRTTLATILLGYPLVSTIWLTSSDALLDAQIADAVNCATDATMVVDGVYRSLEATMAFDVSPAFAPDAQGAAEALVQRHENGEFDTYMLERTELETYTPMTAFDNSGPLDTVVSVTIVEFSRGTEGMHTYRYRVATRWAGNDKGGWSATPLIESVELCADSP